MIKHDFIVRYGFDDKDRVIISEDELEKALYIQKYRDVAVLNGKQVNGVNIIVIEPYRIVEKRIIGVGGEEREVDFTEYENLESGFAIVKKTREKIDHLIRTGRKNLIGTNANIPELEHNETDTKALPQDIQKKLGDISSNFKIQ